MEVTMMWICTALVSVVVFISVVKSTFRGYGRRKSKVRQIASCVLGLVAVLLLCAIVMTVFCWNECKHTVTSKGPYITYYPNRSWRDTSPKLILLWTTNYGAPYWGLPSDGSYKFADCPVSDCRITVDKERFEESDAVFFHGRTLWNYYLGHAVPPHHPNHQIWVYFDLEPPPLVYLDMKAYSNFFNWTLTYRTDSDVVNPYGKMVRIDNEAISWQNEKDPILRAAGETVGKVYSTIGGVETVKRNYHGEKTKFAAWTASNCIANSRRYRVVKQLRNYMDIDMFGKCGGQQLKCSNKRKEEREACDDELGQYRFYLAFENSLCKDYHTEKLWFALQRAQIPVVYGGCDYSKFIPRNSYIDVQDFNSIREVAEYIKKVDSNEELYNSYLWWYQHYKVEVYPCSWCDVCAALHDKSRPAQVYSDLDGWFNDDVCPGFSIPAGVAKVVEGWLLYYGLVG